MFAEFTAAQAAQKFEGADAFFNSVFTAAQAAQKKARAATEGAVMFTAAQAAQKSLATWSGTF